MAEPAASNSLIAALRAATPRNGAVMPGATQAINLPWMKNQGALVMPVKRTAPTPAPAPAPAPTPSPPPPATLPPRFRLPPGKSLPPPDGEPPYGRPINGEPRDPGDFRRNPNFAEPVDAIEPFDFFGGFQSDSFSSFGDREPVYDNFSGARENVVIPMAPEQAFEANDVEVILPSWWNEQAQPQPTMAPQAGPVQQPVAEPVMLDPALLEMLGLPQPPPQVTMQSPSNQYEPILPSWFDEELGGRR